MLNIKIKERTHKYSENPAEVKTREVLEVLAGMAKTVLSVMSVINLDSKGQAFV